jgi:hypothetical protein
MLRLKVPNSAHRLCRQDLMCIDLSIPYGIQGSMTPLRCKFPQFLRYSMNSCPLQLRSRTEPSAPAPRSTDRSIARIRCTLARFSRYLLLNGTP